MGSQTDLDQGGTYRPYTQVWMGPSIGWINAPQAVLRVTAGGTTVVQLGNTIVTVNFNGAVTIQLPKFKALNNALPGQLIDFPVTVIDTGGFAGANPITILPGAGELISGLASIQITSPFGAF